MERRVHIHFIPRIMDILSLLLYATRTITRLGLVEYCWTLLNQICSFSKEGLLSDFFLFKRYLLVTS